MPVSVVTPAVDLVVTLVEAKAQCRVDGTNEDTLIDGLRAAATDFIETYTGRSLMSQTLRMTLDAFTDTILLERGPVQSVSSVRYFDPDGNQQTVSSADYTLDNVSSPPWLVRNSEATWPTTIDGVNAVSIDYQAGYETLPPSIKQAALLLIEHWYDNRSGTSDVPPFVTALLANHRYFLL